MKIMERNKQSFFYCLFDTSRAVTNAEGDETGEYKVTYKAEVEMKANISAATGYAQVEQFGNFITYDKVIVTDDMSFAEAVAQEIERQIPLLIRADIARVSIDDNGKIIVTDDLDRAVEVANQIAPEHLEICLDNPFDYLDKIKHAGSVFLGRYCPEALGDYYAGSNHTLPTSGTARFSSALSVDDFIKKTQYVYYDEQALKEVCDEVAYFATKEGLTAHAKSAVIRFEKD